MSNTLQTLTYRFTLNAFKNGVQRILQGWATGENLARKLEISLSAGQEAYELPMEGITASMYVTTPTTKTLSINACEIDYENNKIIYEVLPSDISEAGIVNMQLKIFDSAKILVSPSFGLDVWESTISDSQAVLSPTYTALTEALAEASAYSQKAISQVYVDEDYTFVVEFADGTEYTSTAIKDVIDSLVNGGEIAEGWARGTQEGVPVEEGSPYYHDNASYWSGQAHGYSGMAENAKQFAYEYAGDANTAKVAAQGYSTSASGFADEANKWANGKVGETDVPSTAPQYHNNAKYWSEQSQALGNAEYLAAKSYAVGGTGTRAGEDLDNAKYYKEICESIVGGDYPAEDVTYQNTVSGLTADNAQDALDELAGMINGVSADDVAYDNTDSGLTATDVQDAVDELAGMIGGISAEDVAYDNTTSGLTATKVQGAIDETIDFAKDNISAIVNVYGSKNLNSYPYYTSTTTSSGVTITDLGDGRLKVGSDSAQTASANTAFVLHRRDSYTLVIKDGNYKLSGCPIGGSLSGYYILASYKDNNSNSITLYDTGNGVNVDIINSLEGKDNTLLTLTVYITKDTVIPAGGIIFEPMIRDARISDDTFVPYAKTNRELTEDSDKIELKLIAQTSSSGTCTSKLDSLYDVYQNLSINQKLRAKIKVETANQIFHSDYYGGGFAYVSVNATTVDIRRIELKSSGSTYYEIDIVNSTQTNYNLGNTTNSFIYSLYA